MFEEKSRMLVCPVTRCGARHSHFLHEVPMLASRLRSVALSFALLVSPMVSLSSSLAAQAAPEKSGAPRASVALEADVLAYGINGYSGVLNVSLRNGLQVAFGSGRYDVPTFLVKGDANYDLAQWKATSTSVQVLRATWRVNGPMRNGPAVGAIILNQQWRMASKPLRGETTFRPVSAGLTGGYYHHLGKHFYIYPTAAFTYNRVVSGRAEINGTRYKVSKFGPNGSLHMGWERAW
jgi:hypothetical protein